MVKKILIGTGIMTGALLTGFGVGTLVRKNKMENEIQNAQREAIDLSNSLVQIHNKYIDKVSEFERLISELKTTETSNYGGFKWLEKF